MAKVTATELERQIFEIEEIRTVVRSKRGELFEEYPYKRKAAVNTSITDWYATRLKPIIGETDADVVDGTGVTPHGRSNIETVRNSYVKK